jgi:HECT-domain (ubiquitin-transferase)
MVEWRIQKRVEEQFNSFLSGFNELIPQDLINVFDERELEVCEIRSKSRGGMLCSEYLPFM